VAMLVHNLNIDIDTHIVEVMLKEFFTALDFEKHRALSKEEIKRITVIEEKLFNALFKPKRR
jgi:hypothetical protein